jgi:O-antigen/teichoic acid export membrane protein
MEDIRLSHYLKIYSWRLLSLISGFLSLIIVIPHLSTQQDLYGVYAFCITFALYLSYADIGFILAGQKFAAEELAKNNQAEELGITGFTIILLILCFIPFSVFMVFLSMNTEAVLSGLTEKNEIIARQLFLVNGLILPIQVILQRLVDFIVTIRLMDYLVLKITIIFNMIKILSVFYFFKGDQYLLTEYYLFATLLSILGSIISIVLIKNTINYDFHMLFKSLRLSGKYYQKLKKLAISSFGLTLSFIAYNELDLIIIGKWFGVHEVAIYAIGFTFINFVRNLWNIVYEPFSQRLNHFYGQGLPQKIDVMLFKITEYTLPLYIVLVTTLILGAEYLVGYWVGKDYYSSIIILQMLMMSTAFGVFIRPASYYYITCLKYKYINFLAIILPLVFYLVIFLSSNSLGIHSLAVAKIAVSVVSTLVAIKALSALFSISGILKESLLTNAIFLIMALYFLPKIIRQIFPSPQANTENLLVYLMFLFLVVVTSYFLIIFSNKGRRSDLKKLALEWYQSRG